MGKFWRKFYLFFFFLVPEGFNSKSKIGRWNKRKRIGRWKWRPPIGWIIRTGICWSWPDGLRTRPPPVKSTVRRAAFLVFFPSSAALRTTDFRKPNLWYFYEDPARNGDEFRELSEIFKSNLTIIIIKYARLRYFEETYWGFFGPNLGQGAPSPAGGWRNFQNCCQVKIYKKKETIS